MDGDDRPAIKICGEMMAKDLSVLACLCGCEENHVAVEVRSTQPWPRKTRVKLDHRKDRESKVGPSMAYKSYPFLFIFF